MKTALTFRNPPPVFSQAQIAVNLDKLGYPEGWTAADDVALVEGAFMWSGLLPVSVQMRKTYAEVSLRWNELRASTVGHGEWSLAAQRALLDAVTDLAKEEKLP